MRSNTQILIYLFLISHNFLKHNIINAISYILKKILHLIVKYYTLSIYLHYSISNRIMIRNALNHLVSIQKLRISIVVL